MKNFVLLLTLLPQFALAANTSDLQISELHCVATNGVRIDGRDNGRREYTRSIVMDVDTSWFGMTKKFLGTSFFSVKPEGELNVHLRTEVVTNDGGLYFLHGFVADPFSREPQSVTMRLEQPGYAGFNSPGEHLTLAMASCQVTLK